MHVICRGNKKVLKKVLYSNCKWPFWQLLFFFSYCAYQVQKSTLDNVKCEYIIRQAAHSHTDANYYRCHKYMYARGADRFTISIALRQPLKLSFVDAPRVYIPILCTHEKTNFIPPGGENSKCAPRLVMHQRCALLYKSYIYVHVICSSAPMK